MVVTCFFCQSLLSDWIEELLPQSRKKELEGHLAKCPQCQQLHADLKRCMELARSLKSQPISHETVLHVAEACEAGRRKVTAQSASRWAFVMLVPVLVVAGALVWKPGILPSGVLNRAPASQFVRYFPLLEGSQEIIEDHANWLRMREPSMRSLWEEGGISPEEFEKSFTARPTLSDSESSDN